MFEFKQVGETTKEFADRIRKKHNIDLNTKIAICGKLDPQASGVTKILVGDDTVHMSKYLQSKKTYKFYIVIGISTKSDDIMGEIVKTSLEVKDNIEPVRDFMNKVIKNKTSQKYHPISAKKININGFKKKRPLWYWYQKGLLKETDLPEKPVKVYNIESNNFPIIFTFKTYLALVRSRLNSIQNKDNFDIENIKLSWNKAEINKVILLEYIAEVSSGFYIRMIAKNIRDALSIPVHVFDIQRLKVETLK